MADLARKAAYDALMRVEKDGAFSNLAMSKRRELSALDASFATALCMGVLEKRRALDFLIMRHTQKTPDKELLLLFPSLFYRLDSELGQVLAYVEKQKKTYNTCNG